MTTLWAFSQRSSVLTAGTILLAAVTVGTTSAVPSRASESAEVNGRCGPVFIHVEPHGDKLLVLCEKNDTLIRFDLETERIDTAAHLGESPYTLCTHPDGRRLYVSCRRGQEIIELDADSLDTLRRFPLRGDPTGISVSSDGGKLFAGVHSLDQVAVFDLDSGTEIKRLEAGNGPGILRSLPGQGRVYVTNLLSNPVAPDEPCRNEITVIDDKTAQVVERIILENANVGRWIAFASDGMSAVVAISRPKNLIPEVQVARGWVVTNGFAVLIPGSGRPPIQLLVDLPSQSYADPFGITMGPNDDKFYMTCAGLDAVVAVDLHRVRKVIDEVHAGEVVRPADDLGLSRRYVTARISVGADPRALAISHDGRWLYVANRLDDSISVIDTATDRVVRTVVLGSPAPPGRLLRGERFFHSAARTFQGQFSCVSCHPDGGFDGLQYDLEPDGIGQNVIDNRNMRDVVGTGPFKWTGKNPDIATQCGTRTAKWIVRTGWLTSTQVVELTEYIHSIKPVVNPYRSPSGKLTASQRRGKAVFERTTRNDGTPLRDVDRCDFCHLGPKFTDGHKFDVGTQIPGDTHTEFDTGHLINIFESGPYLHAGQAGTLEGIWTKHNPDDKHGVSSDWNKQQLNDLIEYLKSL